mmetsp:Transcript_5954/g.8933  ORF Transcript_5954/g.8933 Transcript_5954/m.8933 type:complete len:174 (-) Transcript_5954:115-636(-)|eukprot:CAMPEP_0203670324 /NCGR_PEP_ID=MMETSP0090-20130426/6430_1 /ASSEMBLY_ACC=CAM_ASM_001088 /TAXON_ID=426623 /ORGANISM="Chaetoceros affinis, Strain CCMP159" /LENGTH=173 /DNA_ID=CAMNT_0050535153 /DNA_START=106 /DNA_END=627 /DNA_ORIENTATION=+
MTANNDIEEEYGVIPPQPQQEQKSSSSSSTTSDKVIGAAAIAGGVAGLVVAGPLVGVIGAVGAGALATQNNKAGDVARASGDVVISAGKRAKAVDEKHHVVDKTKKAAAGVIQKGKDIDEKHHIRDKTKKAASDLVQKTKEFEEKHKLGEKAGKSMTKGLNFISKKLKPKDQQ